MPDPLDIITQQFRRAFGGLPAQIVRAPGRVNLIGEHTDYNDGFVFPMAIEPAIYFAAAPRNDKTFRVASGRFVNKIASIDLSAPVEKHDANTVHWTDYIRGAVRGLQDRGDDLPGMDLMIHATLPSGGGLSSSAALEVGTLVTFTALAGRVIDPIEAAKLGQIAEHAFAGVPCGIMDQMIVARGRAGHAMKLDCRSLDADFVPLDSSQAVVAVVNSMVHHSLADGEYAKRRAACERAAKALGVEKLRDANVDLLEAHEGKMDAVDFRRARHVITENGRCQSFARDLSQGNVGRAGFLMRVSHESLQHDYNVSCPELDFLSEQATEMEGIYGSRMTGGGFGGCTVSLVDPAHAESFLKNITAAYEKQYGKTPDAFLTTATAGAGVVPA